MSWLDDDGFPDVIPSKISDEIDIISDGSFCGNVGLYFNRNFKYLDREIDHFISDGYEIEFDTPDYMLLRRTTIQDDKSKHDEDAVICKNIKITFYMDDEELLAADRVLTRHIEG